MNRSKRCFKCNHVATFDQDPPLACPQCGAIYSKVEQAAQNTPAVPRPASGPVRRHEWPKLTEAPFIDQLRNQSNYPTFRSLVQFLYWFGIVVGVLVAVGAAISLFKGHIVPGLISIASAIAIAFFAKVGKEISLMMCDLSDAAVRIAASADERD